MKEKKMDNTIKTLAGIIIGFGLVLINLFGGSFIFPHISQRHLPEIIFTSIILIIIPLLTIFTFTSKLSNMKKFIFTVIPFYLLLGLKNVIWMAGVPSPSKGAFVLKDYLMGFFFSPMIYVIGTLILVLIPIIIYLFLKKWSSIPFLYSLMFVITTLLFVTASNMSEMFNIGGANAPGYVLKTGGFILIGSTILFSILIGMSGKKRRKRR